MIDHRYELRAKVAGLIQDYVDEKITYDVFLENLPAEDDLLKDTVVAEAVHLVGHIEDDKDIISRDQVYVDYMKREINQVLPDLQRA